MTTQLDMAEQQLYGWNCANTGKRLITMIVGMGLTLKEWDTLIETDRVNFLSESDRDDIVNHLREQTAMLLA